MNDSHDHAAAGPAARRVLAERKNAGIQVTLLWAENTNAVSVLVRDHSTDDQFELCVEPAADALDTFKHPVRVRRVAWRRPSAHRPQRRGVTSDAASPACDDAPKTVVKTCRSHTRKRMNAGANSLLTVRWRDRSVVLRAPEQVEELARRLTQNDLADIAVSIRDAVVDGKTGSGKVLSDEEREAVVLC